MKKLILVFILTFGILHIYCQDVPIINTMLIHNMEYTDRELNEWQRFLDLYAKIESGTTELSAQDRTFYDKWISKFEDIESNMPWIINGPGCSWYCGAVYETHVSSSLQSMGSNNYSKDNLSDDDSRTAWVEGVSGYGIGEYIEFVFPYYAVRATFCMIANGYNKNESTWRKNSRVKTFNMYENDKLIAIVNLKDTRNLQSFKFPHPIPNRPDNEETGVLFGDDGETIFRPVSLKFVITEVYKGDEYDDTAISELIFDGVDVHCLGEGTQITMSDLTLKNIEDIQIGDKILSYNIEKKSFEPKKVKYLHKANHNKLIRLKFKDREIITTDDHPFLTNRGWKSLNPQKTKSYKRYSSISIEKYEVGDLLFIYNVDKQTQVRLEAIDSYLGTMDSYTLELENEGAFIANGLIVGQE